MFRKTFIIIFIVSYLIILLQQPLFAQQELPDSRKYWNYHSWYKNRSVVHLVVSGDDRNHLNGVMKVLKRLKKRNIKIGNIMIVGEHEPTVKQQPQEEKNATFKLVKSLGFSKPSIQDPSVVLEQYGITNSPTWIIWFQGKNFVFEGLRSPVKLFTSEGEFLEPR